MKTYWDQITYLNDRFHWLCFSLPVKQDNVPQKCADILSAWYRLPFAAKRCQNFRRPTSSATKGYPSKPSPRPITQKPPQIFPKPTPGPKPIPNSPKPSPNLPQISNHWTNDLFPLWFGHGYAVKSNPGFFLDALVRRPKKISARVNS